VRFRDVRESGARSCDAFVGGGGVAGLGSSIDDSGFGTAVVEVRIESGSVVATGSFNAGGIGGAFGADDGASADAVSESYGVGPNLRFLREWQICVKPEIRQTTECHGTFLPRFLSYLPTLRVIATSTSPEPIRLLGHLSIS